MRALIRRAVFGSVLSLLVNDGIARACPTCQTAEANRLRAQGISTKSAGEEGNGSFLPAGELYIDLSFEYRKWEVIKPIDAVFLDRAGKHVHDFTQERFYITSFLYGVTDDIEVSLSVPFRDLRSVFVDDVRPAFIGSHDKDSAGLGDLLLASRWRFMREPFEFYAMADLGIPTGDTHNRDRLGRRYEPEFQPGGGGWGITLGLGVAKQWGKLEGHLEARHLFKLKGERDYKFGDSTQLRVGGSYQIHGEEEGWPVFLLGEVVTHFNEPDVDRGVTSGGHRSTLVYLAPGLALRPTPRLTLSVVAPVPVYQNWVLHQEIDYSVRFSLGYSFGFKEGVR